MLTPRKRIAQKKDCCGVAQLFAVLGRRVAAYIGWVAGGWPSVRPTDRATGVLLTYNIIECVVGLPQRTSERTVRVSVCLSVRVSVLYAWAPHCSEWEIDPAWACGWRAALNKLMVRERLRHCVRLWLGRRRQPPIQYAWFARRQQGKPVISDN